MDKLSVKHQIFYRLVIACLFLCFYLSGKPCLAQGVTITIPDGLEGETGSNVEVPVNISGNEVNQVLAGSISFSYDGGVLSSPSVAAGGLLGSVTANTSVPGQVSFSFAGTSPLSGAGTLAVVTFDVVGTAGSNTTLDLTSASLNEGSIAATLEDGSFTVMGGTGGEGVTITIPDGLEGQTGSNVEVPVNISGNEVNQVLAGSISFGYDDGVLSSPSVVAGGLLGSVTGNTSVSGQVSFSFAGTAPLSGAGTLAVVTFDVVGTAGSSTTLDLTSASLNEGSIAATLEDGSFTATGGSNVRGDLTGDGLVNIKDLITLINIILGIE